MATDYIKRIQSNLSGGKKKIKLSRPVIKKELELLGYANETLTDDLTVLVINKLVDKFSNEVETKLLPECEPVDNAPTSQELKTEIKDSLATHEPDIVQKVEPVIVQEIEPSTQSVSINSIYEASTTILQTESEQEIETGIVVSEGDKQELVAVQSSVLDVHLSELETVELCSQIPDVFDDYKSFVDSVTSAIKTFVDEKFDHQETKTVDYSISELRQHIANRQARLDTKFAQGLNDVKEDLEQIRSNIKSRQVAILEKFRIPAKT
ncbi:hypothetical protein NIES2101_42855 [Calothrix sp. HK-06]|nr:hypothetical protein NIES2101_42855 [Calothrix sp. HK-06]